MNEHKGYVPNEAEMLEAQKLMTPAQHLQSAKRERQKEEEPSEWGSLLEQVLRKKMIEIYFNDNMDTQDEIDALFSAIKKEGFVTSAFLYSISTYSELMEPSFGRRSIRVETESEFKDLSESLSPMNLLGDYTEEPIIIVFNPSKLSEVEGSSDYRIADGFSYKDAVVLLIKIKKEQKKG